MKHAEYLQALLDMTDKDAGNDGLPPPIDAAALAPLPFDGFFGDEFLRLLYRSSTVDRDYLKPVIKHLEQVSDTLADPTERAKSALSIGRFIEERIGTAQPVGTSDPLKWYALALDWGNVIGAWARAGLILARADMRVEFRMEDNPLPRLTGEVADHNALGQAQHAWMKGVRALSQHALNHFEGWDLETTRCALACIVNYLVLFPEDYAVRQPKIVVRSRIESLSWIRPIWDRLIDFAPHVEPRGDRAVQTLREQQAAILIFLEHWSSECAEVDTRGLAGFIKPAPIATKPEPEEGVVVMKQPFAPSGDRSEAGILKQYEVLGKPFTPVELPDAARLEQIRQALEEEFPWALEAIDAIMTDLVARQRHGVVRLGMWPVLMAGKPGTGKTRLAQRLSDLLGTPNTIINMAGMRDTHTFKGVSRGWSGSRPSRMVEFISQYKVPNPLFVLDEVDKTGSSYSNGGDPLQALLDLLETGNAKRYQDVFLMTEVDMSHCLYIGTANSLESLPEALLSRFRLVYVPPPAPEHTPVIAKGVLGDIEQHWGLPKGTLSITPEELNQLSGLGPREMRQAMIELFGKGGLRPGATLH